MMSIVYVWELIQALSDSRVFLGVPGALAAKRVGVGTQNSKTQNSKLII
jgi:hypothetical protein